jgi:hypothetical protein
LDNPSRLTGEASRGLVETETLSKKLLRMMTKILLNNGSNDAAFDNAPRLAGRTVEKTGPNGKGLKNQA